MEPTRLTSDDSRLYEVSLYSNPKDLDSASLESINLEYLFGTSELTFGPGDTKVLLFNLVPRDANTVRVASITSVVRTESFDFEYIISGAQCLSQEDRWFQTTGGIRRRQAGGDDVEGIRIHPKPPKVQISIPQLQKEYLTDETVRLELEIRNEEDDDVEVTLEARFLGQADAVPNWTWDTDQTDEAAPERSLGVSEEGIPNYTLGPIERSRSRKLKATFTAKAIATEAVLEVKAIYHVLTEPETPISKVLVHEILFDRPFEANYDFRPCVDHAPLPNYFKITESHNPNKSAHGLRQLWNTTARLASFAPESLVIQDMTLEIKNVRDGAICRIEPGTPSDQQLQATLLPNDFHERSFNTSAQKLDLDDRQSTVIEFQLKVHWHRDRTDASPTTTILAVPDLVIPFGEPRVLATTADLAQQEATDFIPLDYTIENPSTHVLNFDVSMETSDDFAFSGPKMTSVQLVPVSRCVVRYRIVPLVRGSWITPNLRVLDTHFNQLLKVHGTGGMRSDKRGASIWIDAED